LDTIQEAIEKQQRLRIVYAAPRRESSERVVEPYCSWYASGRMYLVAWCLKADDVRVFAVQRIQSAELLDELFEPDPDFEPGAFTRQSFGVYQGPVYRVIVELRPEVAHLVREFRYHHSQRLADVPWGVRLTMQAGGLPEIATWVAGFGGMARPVAPPELVEAVRRLHEEGLEVLTSGGVTQNDNASR